MYQKERFKCLLVSGCLSIAYLIGMIIFYIIENTRMAESSTGLIGGLFAAIFSIVIIPHLVLVGIASVFTWVAYITGRPWAAMTAAILNIAGWVPTFYSIPFVAAHIVLCFVGYNNLKNNKKAFQDEKEEIEADAENNTCIYCGRLREPGEHFSKYDMCPECNHTMHQFVNKRKNTVQETADKIKQGLTVSSEEINHALKLIDELEEKRPKLPFFKSSTAEFKEALEGCTQKSVT